MLPLEQNSYQIRKSRIPNESKMAVLCSICFTFNQTDKSNKSESAGWFRSQQNQMLDIICDVITVFVEKHACQ